MQAQLIAQQTLQTVVLIAVSFVTAGMVYTVPWHMSADPCLLAAVATVVIVAFVWLARGWGSRGVRFERNLLAVFLVGMPVVYVMRYLFASTGRAANTWFWVELLGVPFFAALAILGLKRSPWFLATGILVHGLGWDSWHYRNSTYIPDWYAIFCAAVDLAFAAYVAVRAPTYLRLRSPSSFDSR